MLHVQRPKHKASRKKSRRKIFAVLGQAKITKITPKQRSTEEKHFINWKSSMPKFSALQKAVKKKILMTN